MPLDHSSAQLDEDGELRSGRGRTGYKGVYASYGRYKAACQTPPCHNNYLGNFGTPEEAAQAYLFPGGRPVVLQFDS